MVLPILIYGCDVWGFEETELIEVFHRNFLRRVFRVRKSVPKGMIYDELGRQELYLAATAIGCSDISNSYTSKAMPWHAHRLWALKQGMCRSLILLI